MLELVLITTLSIDNGLGLVPPMAWRSWNAFHNSISQDIMEAQIDALIAKNRTVKGREGFTSLSDCGYKTCGIDEGWEACGKGVNGTQHDEKGNPAIDVSKFPSMSKLVDYGHSKNVKMGWYFNGCACGERKELRVNYEGDVRNLALNNFDAVKIDSCGAQKNMSFYAQLMNETGKTFTIENCHQGQHFPDGGNPYFSGSSTEEWCPFNFFRTSGDIVNLWDRVMSNLLSTQPFLQMSKDVGREGSTLSRPGCFSYPDMLEVGRMGTMAEERSHFAAWCISSSPLVLGFDLRNQTKLDRVWDIITNQAAINVSQTWISPAQMAKAQQAQQAGGAGAFVRAGLVGSSGGLVSSWRAPNLPTIVADVRQSGGANCSGPAPADGFTVLNAALGASHDLHRGNFTVTDAQAWCRAQPLCTGFTFQIEQGKTGSGVNVGANSGADTDADAVHDVYFKQANVVNDDTTWKAYLKYDPTTATNYSGWRVGAAGGVEAEGTATGMDMGMGMRFSSRSHRNTGLLHVPDSLCLDSKLQLPQPGYPNWIRASECDESSPTQQWEQRAVANTSGAVMLYSQAADKCLAVAKHWLWNGQPVVSLQSCVPSSGYITNTFYMEAGSLRTSTGDTYCLGTSKFSGPESQIWAKPLDAHGKKLAVLAINGAELPQNIALDFTQLFHMKSSASAVFDVYDVWTQMGGKVASGNVSQTVAPHDSIFFIVTAS